MGDIDWFYRKNGKRFGPITAADLRKLGASGVLERDDEVWREGLPDWVPAIRVKGLFSDAVATAAAPAESSGYPLLSEPKRVETFGRQADDEGLDDEDLEDEIEPPDESEPPCHLLDHLTRSLRTVLGSAGGDTLGATFVQVGKYALYVAILLGLAFTFYRAVKFDRLTASFDGAAWALTTLVLQYTAVRMSRSIESLIRATPTRMSTTAFADSFALLSIVVSLITLGRFLILAILLGSLALAMVGVAASIVGLYIAALAINYRSLNVRIARDVSAGEEAIAVVTFLIALTMRIVPIVFGVGSTLATIGLVVSCVLFVQGESTVVLGSNRFEDLDRGLMLLPSGPDGWMEWITILASVPLVAYLLFISYYIILDVIRSILLIPGKLDRLAKGE